VIASSLSAGKAHSGAETVSRIGILRARARQGGRGGGRCARRRAGTRGETAVVDRRRRCPPPSPPPTNQPTNQLTNQPSPPPPFRAPITD